MVTAGPVQVVRCVVCGSTRSVDDRLAAQALGLHPPYGVRRCTDCRMRWQSPRPTSSQLAALYASEYFDAPDILDGELARYSGAPARTRRYHHDNRAIVARQQRHHLDALMARFPRGGRLLEVGCGRGGFLHRARADGWKVQGIEPSRSAAEAARSEGLDVTTTTLEAFSPRAPVDVVYSCHVLEHFSDPAAAVRRMASWLTHRGAIYLEVPNQFEAWSQRLANLRRRILGSPRPSSLYSVHHLSFFGPRQLLALFDGAGMRARVTAWSPLPAGGRRARAMALVDRVADILDHQGSNLQVFATLR